MGRVCLFVSLCAAATCMCRLPLWSSLILLAASHSCTLRCAALQDDVAFFWPGLLRALQGLDPADPYFISSGSKGDMTGGSSCRGQ